MPAASTHFFCTDNAQFHSLFSRHTYGNTTHTEAHVCSAAFLAQCNFRSLVGWLLGPRTVRFFFFFTSFSQPHIQYNVIECRGKGEGERGRGKRTHKSPSVHDEREREGGGSSWMNRVQDAGEVATHPGSGTLVKVMLCERVSMINRLCCAARPNGGGPIKCVWCWWRVAEII